MGCQVGETLLYGFEARFGSKKGKPGCPDVSRDEKGPLAHAEDHLEQIPGIQAQDGSAVGSDIPHPLETLVQPEGGSKVGEQDQIVNFSSLSTSFVDTADFAGEQEACRCLAREGNAALDGFL